jgi:alpha-tubulin suppressor-like RCC1 family protein
LLGAIVVCVCRQIRIQEEIRCGFCFAVFQHELENELRAESAGLPAFAGKRSPHPPLRDRRREEFTMKPCSQRSLTSRGTLPTKRRMNLLLASSLLAATSSAALAQDGRLRVWGRNTEQQCNVPSSLGRVTAYAGGIYHSVALKADGTVACWGVVAEGQATVPPGLSGVVGIAAGHYHTAAVRGNGSVVCWGRGAVGPTRDQ